MMVGLRAMGLGLVGCALLAGASSSVAQPRVVESTPIGSVAGRYSAPERIQSGVYGTDLGWSFEHEGQLWVMFGDSWQEDVEGKRDLGVKFDPDPAVAGDEFAIADDALGFVSLSGFPDGQSVEAFVASNRPNDGPSWRAPSPTMTFAPVRPNASNTATPSNKAGPMQPVRDGAEMWSLPAQTPMTGFSNGRAGAASGAFGVFFQNEKLLCGSGQCSNGFECDREVGVCIEEGQDAPTPISQPCVIGQAPRPPFCVRCDRTPFFHDGMCVDTGSSVYDASSNSGRAAAVARIHQVGNARKDNPLRWDSQNWITQRFFNVTSRTVSDFDRNRANGAGNDYRRADGIDPGREVVFLWGRPNFGGVGKLGRDAQLYFAYVPLSNYQRNGRFAWQPQFFAGAGSDGVPMFSAQERDAKALDLDAAESGDQPREQNDMVGQMAVSWVPSLNRWVMLYGGGMGTVFGELIFGEDIDKIDQSTVGPIYIRYAEQPWGPWTAPVPAFEPGDPDEASGQYAPGGILFSERCLEDDCAAPQEAWPTDIGAFYGPDIIDRWTTSDASGTTTLYWHVSTWNPYQVVLMRTVLEAR